MIKDSGEREEFSTGSRRDTSEGKPRLSLLSPIFLSRLGIHCAEGAKKCGDNNWMLGQPVTRYMDSCYRHLGAHLEGNRDEDHLSAAAWNIMGMIHTEEMAKRGLLPDELVDWPCMLEGDIGSETFLREVRNQIEERTKENS